MNLKKLSKQTIDELTELVSHFDNGADITINLDEGEIFLVGVDNLNEQGNIQTRRCYDFIYGVDESGQYYDTSDEMIEQIKEDDEVLKEAKLYEQYEDTKELKKN